MSKNIAAVVLAAGQGTRMKSDLPKVMHKVMGRPMIKHVIATLEDVGAEKIVAVIGEDMEIVKDTVAPYDTAIQYEQLGTGHAVLSAKDKLKDCQGPVMVMYGDTPLVTADTINKMTDKVREGNSVVVLGFRAEDPKKYGRLVVKNNELTKIVEFKDASEEEKAINLCNAGFMCFDGKHMFDIIDSLDNKNASGEYYLTDAVEIARSKGLKATAVEGDIKEVASADSREMLADLERFCQEKKRKEIMESGVTLVAPETVYFSHDTKIGKDTIIEPNVVFGEGVEIGSNTVINAFSHIVQGKIGDKCLVEPFCRVRKGTDIGERTKIGSFCEFKNAKVGVRNRFSHLSYIGDAEIGDYNIFGGGTITCNVSYDYDGTNKRKTKIGNQVFLGSNSILLAPVEVGDNAITAANSAIYQNVEKDALGITRAKQRNISNFSIKHKKTQQS